MNWYKISQDKVMIIIRGVSGSGKSTLAKQLVDGGISLGSDEYFMVDGEYQFDVEKLSEAHEWNVNRAKDAAEKGISPIVIENTNTQFWEISPYAKISQAYGYDIKFTEPDWSPDLKTDEGKWNIDFLRGRNTHGVPDEVLQSMIDRYEYNPTLDKILKSERPDELV